MKNIRGKSAVGSFRRAAFVMATSSKKRVIQRLEDNDVDALRAALRKLQT
jgi:hypothetical protein